MTPSWTWLEYHPVASVWHANTSGKPYRSGTFVPVRSFPFELYAPWISASLPPT